MNLTFTNNKSVVIIITFPILIFLKFYGSYQSAIYWSGITNDIQNVVENCHPCQINAKANSKEPLIISSLPDYPFKQIAMDYFEEIGQKFLVIVDRYSHWFIIYPVNSTDSTSLINVLRSHFTEHGTPEEIFSDNGPPFT
jgi:hypothetical protein